MTPFQLADLAEKTGFDEVAALIRSGTAEAGELYSFVMKDVLDKMPKVTIATHINTAGVQVFSVQAPGGPLTPDRPELHHALDYYVGWMMKEPVSDANVPVWDGDKGAYTVLSAFHPADPKPVEPTSSPETVVWGKEATYSGTKRIDGQASDGTRFRLEKGKARNYWDLAVSAGWGGGKAPTEKWVDLLRGEKTALKLWVDRIMSWLDRPSDKADWPAWLAPAVESESYSVRRELNFSPEEQKAGKAAIHAAMTAMPGRVMETRGVYRALTGQHARRPITITIPPGWTQGSFVVPRTIFTWAPPVAEEAPLDQVLGSAFIEVDIVKAKLPTKWHPQEWHAAVLTVQTFDGSEPVEIGVNAKWLAGLVGAVAGKTGSARYFATATKRSYPAPLAPLLVVGPDGTGAVIMPLRLN